MKKQALIDEIASRMSCTRVQALDFLNAYHSVIIEELNQGSDMTLHGIGILKPVQRKARMGRNPRTGESIMIPDRIVLSFKAASAFLKQLNLPERVEMRKAS